MFCVRREGVHKRKAELDAAAKAPLDAFYLCSDLDTCHLDFEGPNTDRSISTCVQGGDPQHESRAGSCGQGGAGRIPPMPEPGHPGAGAGGRRPRGAAASLQPDARSSAASVTRRTSKQLRCTVSETGWPPEKIPCNNKCVKISYFLTRGAGARLGAIMRRWHLPHPQACH